jgi:hypothetical protein
MVLKEIGKKLLAMGRKETLSNCSNLVPDHIN